MFHMNRHGRIYTGSSDETDEDYSDDDEDDDFYYSYDDYDYVYEGDYAEALNSAGTTKINDATRPSLPDERRIKKERKKANHLRR